MEKKIGSIEAGKQADLTLVDTHSPNLTPIHGRDTVISDLVYSASGANVDTTIVNGSILIERHKFATVDPSVILENVSKATEDLLARSTASS